MAQQGRVRAKRQTTYPQLLDILNQTRSWSSGGGVIRSSGRSGPRCPLTAAYCRVAHRFVGLDDRRAARLLGVRESVRHNVVCAADKYPDELTPYQRRVRRDLLRATGLAK